jgi:hypothetical protein
MKTDLIIIIFGISSALWLMGLIILCFRKSSKFKIKQLKIDHLLILGELRLNYRSQIIALNKMLIGGALVYQEYIFRIDDLRMKCRTYEIDNSFIDLLMIYDKLPTMEDKCRSLLFIANKLDDNNEINKIEFEQHIDKALDELRKIK